MEISYQLTKDDYQQGFKAFRNRTKFSRWRTRIAYASFFLILAVAVFVSIFGPDKTFPNLVLLWSLVAFWTCYLWYAPRGVAKKMITGSPSAALPHTVDVSEGGLYFRTSASESRLTWDLIIGWAEVDRVFALFPSPVSFLPIPKRAMTDDQQKELRTILQKKFAGGK
jgi:YcxB-like protein